MHHALTIRVIALSVMILSVGVGATSYLGARGKAQDAAAMSHVRTAVQAASAWFQDPYGGHGSYRGLSGPALVHEAPVVSGKVQAISLAGGRAYCLADVEARGHSAYVVGGSVGRLAKLGTIVPGRVTLVHATAADAAAVCAGLS
jgi:hypothetical protein